MTHPVPDDEAERVQQVQAFLDVLDPPLGETFEQVTGLASDVCQAEAAALSFVTSDHLRFEAAVGPDLPDTPREEGFCAYALMEPDEVMVVEDAEEDERFKDAPIVQEDPGVRFYAGAPLLTSSGHVLGTICVLDPTPRGLDDKQKRMMKRLRRIAVNKLELRRRTHELESARTDLEETAEDLERSNQDLLNFAHIVSHEFKDPLTHVIGNLELLELTVEDEVDEEAREYLEETKRGMERLSLLVEDLLAYARAGQGPETLEPVDVDGLLVELEEELGPIIEEAEAKIQREDLPTVEGDASMVRRVLKNLLSNALKYRGEEPPRIRVRAEPRGHEARFVVEDNGIGIPQEDQDALFEPFQRARNAAGREGTGVGLALAHRIIERHDGDMGVESEEGEGSRFWFTLPIASEDPSEGPSTA